MSEAKGLGLVSSSGTDGFCGVVMIDGKLDLHVVQM